MQLVDKAGNPVEIPDDKASEAFASGEYGVPKGAPVPVRLASGDLGTVAPEHLQTALEGGAQVATKDYADALAEKKYGGLAGAAAAVGEGAARGLTVGLSDPLAIHAAGLFGGAGAEKATREHLAGIQSTNPIISGAAELGGAAAPFLLSGGASGAAEGAGLAARAGAEVAETARAVDAAAGHVAQAAGAVRAGVQGAGIGNTAIARAGELAAQGVGKVIGEGAGTGAAALGKRLVAKAAQGSVEGALYGAGSEISEDSLGDHELNAEKLLASMGHGALLGGGFAGALEGAGALSRSVLGRVAPSLQSAASEQAWKSLSPLKKFSEEAEARAGGTKAVGRVLIDEGVIPESLAGATPRDLLPRIQEAKGRIGKQLGEAMATSGARVSIDEVTGAVDKIIAPLEKKAGFEPIVGALKEYRASLIDKLAPELETEGAPVTKTVKRALDPHEIYALAQQGPITPEVLARENLHFTSDGKLVKTEETLTAGEKKFARSTEVSVQALFEQRKALDDLVYKEVRSMNPKMHVEFMRDIRGELSDMEVNAIDIAAKKAGSGATGDELRQLRKKYQALAISEKAAEQSTSGMVTNRNFSLSDYGVGIGAMASGHAMVGALGVAAHKLVRERGNAVAAHLLDKLAAIGGVERAATTIDRQIDRGIAGFLRPGTRPELTAKAPPFETHHESVQAVARAVAGSDEHVQGIERAVSGIAPHAPMTATAFQRSAIGATSYLAAQIPSSARHYESPTPHLEKPRISDADRAKFAKTMTVVHDPMSVLADMRKNQLTGDQVKTLKAVYPKLYGQIVKQVQAEMADSKKPLSYDKRKQLSVLMGSPLDPTLSPKFVQSMQANYSMASKRPQSAPSVPGAPKRSLGSAFTDAVKLAGT